MFRHVHFAAQEPVYKQLIEVLVPFEDQLKHKFCVTKRMLCKVVWKIWKYGLCREMRESLRIFIQNNQQSILEHITALKENKDAVIIHKSLELQERFFENVAQAMIPYKELLALSLPIPHYILKIVADCLDGFYLGNSKTHSLQSYLSCNKVALLRRISELNKKATERNGTSVPKMEVIVEIKGLNLVPSTFTFPLPTGALISHSSSSQESLISSLQPHMSLVVPRSEISKPDPRTKTSKPSPPAKSPEPIARPVTTPPTLLSLQISRPTTPPNSPSRAHSTRRPLPSPPRDPAMYNHWPDWSTKTPNSPPRTKTSNLTHRTKTPELTHRTKTHELIPRPTPTPPKLMSFQISQPSTLPVTPPVSPSRAHLPRRPLPSPLRDSAMNNQWPGWSTKTPKRTSRNETHEPIPRPTPTPTSLMSLQISRPSTLSATRTDTPSRAHSARRPPPSPPRDSAMDNQWPGWSTKTPNQTSRTKTHDPILRPTPTHPSLMSLQISRPSTLSATRTDTPSRAHSPRRPLLSPPRDGAMDPHQWPGWSTKISNPISRTKTRDPVTRPTPTLPSLMSLQLPGPSTPPDSPLDARLLAPSSRRSLISPPRDRAVYSWWPGSNTL